MAALARAGTALTASALVPAGPLPSPGLAACSFANLHSLRGASTTGRDPVAGCLHTASSSSSFSARSDHLPSSSASLRTASWAAAVAALFGVARTPSSSRVLSALAGRRRLAAGHQVRLLAAQAGAATSSSSTAVKSAISEIDFRVGEIVSAEAHESSDKLIVELIDIGEEKPRQICSGLREYFTPESLVGQRVVVVANLKERKMAGTPSNGMVLCASKTEGESSREIAFVEPPAGAPVGERVKIEVPGEEFGEPSPANKVLLAELIVHPAQVQKKKMFEKVAGDLCTDDKGMVCYKDFPFLTASGPCTSSLASGTVS